MIKIKDKSLFWVLLTAVLVVIVIPVTAVILTLPSTKPNIPETYTYGLFATTTPEITPAVSPKPPAKPALAPVAPVVKVNQLNPYPDIREQILTAINDIRAEKGLLPLKRSSRLDASAQNKADAMVRLDFFAHNDPDGSEPWHYFLEQGYTYYYAGENLSKNYTPGDAIKAWIASPTHYANIVDPHYTETGIVIEGPYIVEHFGDPK